MLCTLLNLKFLRNRNLLCLDTNSITFTKLAQTLEQILVVNNLLTLFVRGACKSNDIYKFLQLMNENDFFSRKFFIKENNQIRQLNTNNRIDLLSMSLKLHLCIGHSYSLQLYVFCQFILDCLQLANRAILNAILKYST